MMAVCHRFKTIRGGEDSAARGHAEHEEEEEEERP